MTTTAVKVEGCGRLDERMFVVRASVRSMEPKIHDGDLCVMRANPVGSRQGKIVLAHHRDISDPDTGGAYISQNLELNPGGRRGRIGFKCAGGSRAWSGRCARGTSSSQTSRTCSRTAPRQPRSAGWCASGGRTHARTAGRGSRRGSSARSPS